MVWLAGLLCTEVNVRATYNIPVVSPVLSAPSLGPLPIHTVYRHGNSWLPTAFSFSLSVGGTDGSQPRNCPDSSLLVFTECSID